jgi:hypothetical protein
MRVFRARPRPDHADVARPPVCHRCGETIPLEGRAVTASSILKDSEPAMFHLDCAPTTEDLRWHSHREIPVRVVSDEAGSNPDR